MFTFGLTVIVGTFQRFLQVYQCDESEVVQVGICEVPVGGISAYKAQVPRG